MADAGKANDRRRESFALAAPAPTRAFPEAGNRMVDLYTIYVLQVIF